MSEVLERRSQLGISEEICAWPKCSKPAFCTTGNFGDLPVCGEHFKITNGPRAELPKLNYQEQDAFDNLLKTYRAILGWGLSANRGELTAAVHVIQGFIVQRMLSRLAPDSWGNWYLGFKPEASTEAP